MSPSRPLFAATAFAALLIAAPYASAQEIDTIPVGGDAEPRNSDIGAPESESASAPAPARAAPSYLGGKRLGFQIAAALEFGGDDVATVLFTDGSSQDVKAGQGITIAAGMHYLVTPKIDLQATIGYKYVTTQANNADINLSRIPVEISAHYLLPNDFHIGIGGVTHQGIKFESDGVGEDAEFDDAYGVTASLGWRWVSLSYTDIDYKDEGGNKFDASNFGLRAKFMF